MSSRRAMIEEAIGGFRGVTQTAATTYGQASADAAAATRDIMEQPSPLFGGTSDDDESTGSSAMAALGQAGYVAGVKGGQKKREKKAEFERLAGMTPKQISDEMGIDLSTATSMHNRAVKRTKGKK